ncbi:MAG: tRNA-binding protein [Flavobacterium sp.]|jgi:tRNA-binding protein
MENNNLTWSDFKKVEMRVGTILKASELKKANKPAYVLEIDFGHTIGVKKSSAQITEKYSILNLIGKQVIAVVNFPTKQIASLQSECLVLGAVDGNFVVLINPEVEVKNGLRIG